MNDAWTGLLEILILLASALLLGTIAEQLRQSALLGYLLAGALVGPNVLGLVGEPGHVEMLAELGVALLLFSIGLEFSVARLRRLGRIALVGGTFQVLMTMLACAGVASVFGLPWRASFAIGAIVAMSSTACVVQLLKDRTAIDSLYGRCAVAVVLLQDAALIPLMLFLLFLSGEGTLGEAAVGLGRALVLVVALIGVLYVLFRLVVPKLLHIRQWSRNREFPILLAIVAALGSASAAHAVSLSPAMGAFVAGVMLGASPFAVQIRADVGSIRTVLVTLFFASVGMLGEPRWVADHWGLVLGTVLALLMGKTVLTGLAMRLAGARPGIAVATGLCVAQVGEFSFVLAEMARGSAIDEHIFRLIVSATIITLFLTPFMVRGAPNVASWIESRTRRRLEAGTYGKAVPLWRAEGQDDEVRGQRRIFIIGFGPAGQAVAASLTRDGAASICVIELNALNAAIAERDGLHVQIGDATQREVLEHAHVEQAEVVIVTIPDPPTCRTIIHLCKALAPVATIVARARYHVTCGDLEAAGATHVVDEEREVGENLALATLAALADS